ncbi:MAG: hypothetical protein SFW67_31435 [Myxococcaceae bacterium]|nr:hypothetical protein [Myxococcaceae bacterium]
MSKKTMKYQARRPMPRIRTKSRARTTPTTLTLGDLIAAAYDSFGDTRSVARVLGSHAMAERIGVQLVIG